MKLKILILFPNTSNEGVAPLAVATLSAIAKEKGYEVRYFETSFYKMYNSAYEERKKTGEFIFTINKFYIKRVFFYIKKFLFKSINSKLTSLKRYIVII